MTGFDTARGPRRAAPPGTLDAILRRGRRRLRVRHGLASAGAAAMAAVTGATAFVPGVAQTMRHYAAPVLGDPEFEGEEWVRMRLPYDDVRDGFESARCVGLGAAVQERGWCAVVIASAVDPAYGAMRFEYTLCRLDGPATLTWSDFGEVRLRVDGPRGVAWTWPDGPLNTAIHDVGFDDDQCRVWSQGWRPGATPAGRYTVTASPTAYAGDPADSLPPAATMAFDLG